jgi:hypothetical protein
MARQKKRLLVLMRPKDPDDPSAGNAELGTPAQLVAACAAFNTAPDGARRGSVGTEVLYGPGFVLEYAQNQKSLSQALVNVNEVDIAWPVLSKLCRAQGWKMQDAESGQVFG